MAKKASKKSSLDPGFEDDGNYDGQDFSPEPQQQGETPKSTRKSAAGRSLKRWAPGEDQLLLLYVDQVCVTNDIALPWDLIAQAMEPREGNPSGPMTGEAVKQHLAKLRTQREGQGQDVPPKVDRATRRRVAAMTPGTAVATPGSTNDFGIPTPVTKQNKRPTLLAPMTKKEEDKKKKADQDKAKQAAKDAKEAKAKAKATIVPKTPVKQRGGRIVKAQEDIMNTPSTIGFGSGSKRGRTGGYGEGAQDVMETPLPKRLRPAYEVDYAAQCNLAGDEEDEEDVDYKETVEAAGDHHGLMDMAMRGHGSGGMHNGTAATTGMGGLAYTAPTANMAMAMGQTNGYSGGMDSSSADYWTPRSESDNYLNVETINTSFDSSMYGVNSIGSSGDFTLGSFGGLPTLSPGQAYGSFNPATAAAEKHGRGGFGGVSVFGGLATFQDEPLVAIPSTGDMRFGQKQSQDSALGSSLPHTPVGEHEMAWNPFDNGNSFLGDEYLGANSFLNGMSFDDYHIDAELKVGEAQDGGFAALY